MSKRILAVVALLALGLVAISASASMSVSATEIRMGGRFWAGEYALTATVALSEADFYELWEDLAELDLADFYVFQAALSRSSLDLTLALDSAFLRSGEDWFVNLYLAGGLGFGLAKDSFSLAGEVGAGGRLVVDEFLELNLDYWLRLSDKGLTIFPSVGISFDTDSFMNFISGALKGAGPKSEEGEG